MRDPREVVLPSVGSESTGGESSIGEQRFSVLASLRMDPHQVLECLPGPHATRRRIQQHCQLAEGGASRFSVVVFEVGGSTAEWAVRLVRALWKRARGGDEIGWFGRRRLAVLLPDTLHAAAHRFATDLSRLLAAAGEPPQFQVICL